MHWIGFGLCHQLPARSLFGGAHQVPVCARDTGIYVGFVVSYLIVVALARGSRPAETPPIALMVIGVALIAAMGFDGISSYAGWRETSNELRLATGLGAGYGIGLFLVPLLNSELWRTQSATRPLGQWWEGALWVASLPVAYAVTWWLLPWLDIGYPLLVTGAILVTFTLVNLVLVAVLTPYDRRAERLSDLVVPVVAAFALTVVELAGAAALKLWTVGVTADWLRQSSGGRAGS
jgi:uncharacterized membrane protein